MRPFADLRELEFVQVLTRERLMIVTPQILVRIVAIVVLARAAAALLLLAGRAASTPAPTSCPRWSSRWACSAAAWPGAVSGFSVGLLIDCLLVEALGATSLVLLSVGYLAGLYRERFDVTNSLVPPLLCMGLTLLAELSFGAVQLMLGVDAPISTLVIRDMVIKSIYAFFLGDPDLHRDPPRPAPGADRGARGAPRARSRG